LSPLTPSSLLLQLVMQALQVLQLLLVVAVPV